MFDVGGGELILIVLAVLLLFGPKKIPEFAQMFGKGMQHVRKAQAQFKSQMDDIQSEIKNVTHDEQYDIMGPPPVKRDQAFEEVKSKNSEDDKLADSNEDSNSNSKVKVVDPSIRRKPSQEISKPGPEDDET